VAIGRVAEALKPGAAWDMWHVVVVQHFYSVCADLFLCNASAVVAPFNVAQVAAKNKNQNQKMYKKKKNTAK